MAGQCPILVVEDDRDVREALVEVLRAEGYLPFAAGDGEEALAQLESGLEPCVILLDLMMPRMNGWQFMDEQRQRESRTPVIVVSAYDTPERMRGIGANEYMRKPVDIDALLE